MADSEQSERETSPPATSGRETVDDKILAMFQMQQESNNNFQNQIMQILSTMANAQTLQTQAQTALPSPLENAQVQNIITQGSDAVVAASSQVRLTKFDPDDTPFTMLEWIDDVTRIKNELGISDTLIVLKAGHALQGRAACFYQHWKPNVRDWASFKQDFEIAFPEQGTPATRLRACLAVTSANFDSLVEYGNA